MESWCSTITNFVETFHRTPCLQGSGPCSLFLFLILQNISPNIIDANEAISGNTLRSGGWGCLLRCISSRVRFRRPFFIYWKTLINFRFPLSFIFTFTSPFLFYFYFHFPLLLLVDFLLLPTRSMAATTQSSGCFSENGKRLPLVLCPICKVDKVVSLSSTTPENPGRVFFKCRKNRRNVSLCLLIIRMGSGLNSTFWKIFKFWVFIIMNLGFLSVRFWDKQSYHWYCLLPKIV